MSRSVRVSIAGSDFSVRTDAKPKYVRELASFVEGKMREVRQSSRGMSTQTVVMMAAMRIADDLLQAQVAQKELRKQVKERSLRILDALDREAKSQ